MSFCTFSRSSWRVLFFGSNCSASEKSFAAFLKLRICVYAVARRTRVFKTHDLRFSVPCFGITDVTNSISCCSGCSDP